jgi:hypothetical protein
MFSPNYLNVEVRTTRHLSGPSYMLGQIPLLHGQFCVSVTSDMCSKLYLALKNPSQIVQLDVAERCVLTSLCSLDRLSLTDRFAGPERTSQIFLLGQPSPSTYVPSGTLPVRTCGLVDFSDPDGYIAHKTAVLMNNASILLASNDLKSVSQ